nr:MAG TPA: hypothetical protein [Caudoviricetes sp.]
MKRILDLLAKKFMDNGIIETAIAIAVLFMLLDISTFGIIMIMAIVFAAIKYISRKELK